MRAQVVNPISAFRSKAVKETDDSEDAFSATGLEPLLSERPLYTDATAGGIATPVGTPPNAIFMQQMHDFWPTESGVSFLMFMAAAFPVRVRLGLG